MFTHIIIINIQTYFRKAVNKDVGVSNTGPSGNVNSPCLILRRKSRVSCA